ncbi:SDR family NAD(P)-dependent oxidoreductase [Planctomycetaceae bacterium SH139]
MKNRKVCLVVGASSGIGKAAAEALAGRGHRVYGTSRDASRVTISNVVGLELEINDDHSIQEAVRKILDGEQRIDAMFYAAGFYTAGAIEETTPEQIHQQLDAYFIGAHRVTRVLLPHFREAGAGRLLYMSSNAGDAALPYHTIYSCSKAALQIYCDGLRYEVEPLGIQVSYLQNGGVKTGAEASFRRAAEPVAAYDGPRDRAIAAFHRMQQKGPVPKAIGNTVADAIEARAMKPVVRADGFSKLIGFLGAVMPSNIFRSQLKKSLDIA